MTALGSSNTTTIAGSILAVAHLVMKVTDIKKSCKFYSNIGIPPNVLDKKFAIIELRGGTHLLLFEGDQMVGDDVAESLTGQFHERFSEKFDLMINGKSLKDLKKYRMELIKRGIAAGDIPKKTFYGHHLFCLKDPDGNGITIYTSHEF